MANINAIQTLIELCSQQSEEAATRLGLANKTRTEAQQKLSMLEEYRNEYAEQLQVQLSQGLNAVGYSNFKQFIATLDQTINQQKHVVQNSLILVENHRTDWQASERKRLSYSTLTKRAETALRHQENKHDQKQTDEHASRIKMRRL
jgi:flagellar FliJ protein